MKYSISYNNPQNHFIDFKVSINVEDKTKIQLQLPSWRPGRYELGNFAKNIKDFKVFDDQHISIPFEKLTKDLWLIETNKLKEVNISYSYYAAELNAGSTFLNEEQLYINPVNCMLYCVCCRVSGHLKTFWRFIGDVDSGATIIPFSYKQSFKSLTYIKHFY